MHGLARAVDGDGSLVCEGWELGEVLDDPLTVVVNGANVACDYLVIATRVPLMGLTGLLSATLFQTKLYPYSSYVLGVRLSKDALVPGLYFVTYDPYYDLRYKKPAPSLSRIRCADHKTGQSADTETLRARCLRHPDAGGAGHRARCRQSSRGEWQARGGVPPRVGRAGPRARSARTSGA